MHLPSAHASSRIINISLSSAIGILLNCYLPKHYLVHFSTSSLGLYIIWVLGIPILKQTNIRSSSKSDSIWLLNQDVYRKTHWTLIQLPHWDNSLCIIYICILSNGKGVYCRTELSWFCLGFLCGKQDGAENVLPSSYTGTGEPANLQCHSSAATATARWAVRYLCMCVLRQLGSYFLLRWH